MPVTPAYLKDKFTLSKTCCQVGRAKETTKYRKAAADFGPDYLVQFQCASIQAMATVVTEPPQEFQHKGTQEVTVERKAQEQGP